MAKGFGGRGYNQGKKLVNGEDLRARPIHSDRNAMLSYIALLCESTDAQLLF